MNNHTFKKYCCCFLIAAIAGCSSPTTNVTSQPPVFSNEELRELVVAEASPNRSVIISDTPIVEFEEIVVPQNPVDLKITEPVKLKFLLDSVANDNGWSVDFIESAGMDSNKEIIINLTNVSFHDAVEKIASSANYIAIFEEKFRRILITERATFAFRFPPSLAQNLEWSLNVGGDPASTFGLDSSGDGGGGLTANSNISSNGVDNSTAIIEFLREAITAGNESDAPIAISAQLGLGLVLVAGNVKQLNRAKEIIDRLLREATTRVEVNIAIVEALLTKDNEIGIDWQKIIRSAGGNISFNVRDRQLSGSEIPFSTGITKGSFEFLLTALKEEVDLKVVTRPNFVIDNHTPADIVDGSIVPYLQSVNPQTNDAGNVTGFEVNSANALDGLKLSIVPHVLGEQIQLRILPFIGKVPAFEVFEYGNGGSLTLPRILSKQALLNVTLADGETLILAGNRVTDERRGERGIPFFSTSLTDSTWNNKQHREVSIILNVKIIPPPDINPIATKML